jgi:hypothetical protein
MSGDQVGSENNGPALIAQPAMLSWRSVQRNLDLIERWGRQSISPGTKRAKTDTTASRTEAPATVMRMNDDR